MIDKKIGNHEICIAMLDSPLTPIIFFSITPAELLFNKKAYLLNQVIVDPHTKSNTGRNMGIKLIRIDFPENTIQCIDIHSLKNIIICDKAGKACDLSRVGKRCSSSDLFHIYNGMH